jgi:hypothetical protein
MQINTAHQEQDTSQLREVDVGVIETAPQLLSLLPNFYPN